MKRRVAVLGPGAVGGALAVRLSGSGTSVVCVAPSDACQAIRAEGLTLEAPDGTHTARPEATDLLSDPVSLLLVAVKAPALAEALERVEVFAVADGVALSLLNGLEHPETIRRRLGPRVAVGSVSRLEAYRRSTTRIVQTTRSPLVTVASDDLPVEELDQALELLRRAGIEIVLEDDEKRVLWEKAARLGPLAAVTAKTQRTVGELRSDPEWRSALSAAIEEACAVAAADGVDVAPSAQWAIIEAMPATLTTSTARDVASGRPSELDAIAGAIVRAGRRLRIETPVLEGLLEGAVTP
jgi:2-dehydropantoate 2-reductase